MGVKLVYHTIESMKGGFSPLDDAIQGMVSRQPIRIACPYLNLSYLKSLILNSKDWRLLTDVRQWLFALSKKPRQQVSAFIRQNGNSIRHCEGLHAKVIVSKSAAFFGSANFTTKGIGGRVEMSALFEECPQVAEIGDWFDELWNATLSISDDDLTKLLKNLPNDQPRPPTLLIKTPFPGIKAKIRSKEIENPIEANTVVQNPEIEKALRGKSREIRQLVNVLRGHLESERVQIRVPDMKGGSIRHHYTGVNFSEMRFRQDAVWLYLRVGQGNVDDSELKQMPDHSGHLYRVLLIAGKQIPSKVIDWIEQAKRFTQSRF